MTPELAAACVDAMHVITAEGEVLKAGEAWLYILGRNGWPFTASFLATPPMIWCVEAGYVVVARNRVFFSRFVYTREYPQD